MEHKGPVVPLAEDFSGYEASADSPGVHTGLHHHTDSSSQFDPSSWAPSPLDNSQFETRNLNLGYNFNQNLITTQPAARTRNTRQRKTTRTRPCSCCRRRKTKCVVPSDSKVCVECAKRNMDCIFEPSPDEILLRGSPVCDNCNHRRTTCLVPKRSSVCTECTLRDLPCKFSESVNTNAKIRTNIPIRDYDEYQGHTILKKTLSLQGPKSSKLLGSSSVIERNLMSFKSDEYSPNAGHSPTVVLNQEQLILDFSSKLRKINDDTIFKIVNDNEEFIKLAYSQVDEIEQIVFPHGLALLNLFFTRVHPLLPVISRPVFLEKYSRTHREFDPLLLAMVYLQALNLWHLDPQLRDLQKPNYEKLERFVLIMYSENLVNSPPKLSTCQGLILLMHYDFKGSSNALFKKDDYWKKISQLVTICEELGLNYNSDDWLTIPNWERKVRKILAWALIMMDKTYSLLESRPSRISPDNWVLNELRSEDFQVEDDEEVFIEKSDGGENFVVNHGRLKTDPIQTELTLFGNLIFAKMVHLSYHVNDSLSSIFNLKSVKFDDFMTVIAKSDQLLTNLSSWYKTLPFHIRDIQIVSNQISTASLNLSYYLVHFLIHRRILNSFIDSLDVMTDEQFNKFKPHFKAVWTLVRHFNDQFMDRLTNEHFTDCFWYSSTTNALINVAIVHQLLLKIVGEEFYIDDEISYEDLKAQNDKYLDLLQGFQDVSYNVTRALDHIGKFICI